MKKFIGKVLYFIYAGISNLADILGKHHIINEKTMNELHLKALDGMGIAVLVLMKQRNYRRFQSGLDLSSEFWVC